MSCGPDCQEMLDKLHLLLDQENELADLGEVERHLEECSQCLDEFTVERLLKSLVSRSCKEAAPDVLHERVLLTIRTIQVDFSVGE